MRQASQLSGCRPERLLSCDFNRTAHRPGLEYRTCPRNDYLSFAGQAACAAPRFCTDRLLARPRANANRYPGGLGCIETETGDERACLVRACDTQGEGAELPHDMLHEVLQAGVPAAGKYAMHNNIDDAWYDQ